MVKRMLCLLAAVLLLPCLAFAGAQVVDDASLFSAAEISQMEDIIQRIADEYQMDVVVLTTYDVPATSSDAPIQDYADLYYENNGYGLGDDKAGLLYMIDMTNRAPCISTSGVMIDYITDSRLEDLFDVSADFLSSGQYGQAALKLLNRLEAFLEEGRLEGSFRYDAETGKRLSGLYNVLTDDEMLLAAVCGVAVALFMYFTVSGRYSLKGSTYTYDRDANTDCEITSAKERFVRETRRVIRNQSGGNGSHGGSSGGGSAVHTSSSGGSHGGGVGGRF